MQLRIAINSDAHSRGPLRISVGVITARRGWAEPDDVINTMGIRKLRRWLGN